MDCLFCKIIKKKVPAEIIYEDAEIIGFKNIQPEAPIHLILVPKKHFEWRDKFKKEELLLFEKLIFTAQKIAIQQRIIQASKLIFNIGKTAHISHIHLHLLGGWKKKIPMHNI